jgi:hypothetical protein
MSNPGPATTTTSNTTQDNVNQDTGHQVGGAAASLVGFWGATPVAQQNSLGTITDASGGSAAATNGILTLTGSYNSTILANAIATLAAQINSMDAALVTAGILKS